MLYVKTDSASYAEMIRRGAKPVTENWLRDRAAELRRRMRSSFQDEARDAYEALFAEFVSEDNLIVCLKDF